MESTEKIKDAVRKKYSQLAERPKLEEGGCCSAKVSCVGDDYTHVDGYITEADLGLGCGTPTESARIKTGDAVLDLGSGAGNDVFLARAIVGATGKVIGVDMTEAMIEKAKENAVKLGLTNAEFHLGEIESLPVDENSIDVVISNCALNLVPDKHQAFSEICRVLKPGGHFSISDVVVEGELPDRIRQLAEGYVGCVAGAMPKGDYLRIIEENGFVSVKVVKQKPIFIPDDALRSTLSERELKGFRASSDRVVSVTVYGEKPTRN